MATRREILDWGTVAELPDRMPGSTRLAEWLQQGMHATMDFMPRTASLRGHPHRWQPQARSAVVFLWRYPQPISLPGHREGPKIAAYAQGLDYHHQVRQALEECRHFLAAQGVAASFFPFVDAQPVAEREMAVLAGLGWLGKNTCLLHPRFGSGFFLAGFLLSEVLESRYAPREDACASCTRCLDACPTQAFVKPGVLDARRCISYLNIELRTPIPSEQGDLLQNWLFGCDICQQVCPWNRAHQASIPQTASAIENYSSNAGVSELSEPVFPQGWDAWVELLRKGGGFGGRLGKTPLQRAGRKKLASTLALLLENAGKDELLARLREGDESAA